METYVLKIDKKHRDSLVARFKEEKKQLLLQISEIDSYLLQLGEEIGTNNNKQLEFTSSKYQGYIKKWPYIRKVKFLLQKEKKLLSVREIVDRIIENEPDQTFEKIRKSVAGVISERLKKNRDIGRIYDEAGVSLIGHIDWFVSIR